MRKFLVVCLSIFMLFSFTNAFANPKKPWTLLIFINGKNNLEDFAVRNIIDMEKVGSNDWMNIVVQWEGLSNYQATRMLIKKSDDPSQITSPILQNLGNVDMGSHKILENFLLWGILNFPADHYLVDVWDHGSGWHLKNNTKKFARKNDAGMIVGDISYDEETGSIIKTEELGSVMNHVAKKLGRKVDIYASDACLMAMIEVADEMKNAVNIFAGSEDLEPAEGWPYEDFLNQWQKSPKASAKDVAALLVKSYVAAYSDGVYGRREATFSAFDLNYLPQLEAAIKYFGEQITALSKSDQQKIAALAKTTKHFEFDAPDMVHFLQKINDSSLDLKAPSTALSLVLKQFIFANAVEDEDDAYGLSFWLPLHSADYDYLKERYQNLEFNKATNWSKALSKLVS